MPVSWCGLFLVVFVLLAGCSRPQVPAPAASGQSGTHTLTPTEAAQWAAQLANKECDRRYQRQPFAPDQHPARLTDTGYRWGGLDEGAQGGLSALVTFAPDGSNPQVEVYFSTDAVEPRRFPAKSETLPPSPSPR